MPRTNQEVRQPGVALVVHQWAAVNATGVQARGSRHGDGCSRVPLVLATGMGLVVRKLWVPHPRAAQGILGILFMHLSAGLSNTNMVHNYYGAMLSLSISLALVMAASEEAQQKSL